MVTGRQPFRGDYDKAIMYSILNEEPEPITALRTGVPMDLEIFVNKCLAKSTAERYQHADEVAVDLAMVHKNPVRSADPEPTVRLVKGAAKGWLTFAAASVAFTAIGMGLAFWYFERPEPRRAVVRHFTITPTPEAGYPRDVDVVRISPDGRHIVYVSDEIPSRLWLRSLDRPEQRPIPGTEGAIYGMFWSPDSASIGFSVGDELKRVSIESGDVMTLCEHPGQIYDGGAWSSDGSTIIFGSGSAFPLVNQVSARGGNLTVPFEAPIVGSGLGQQPSQFLPLGPRRSALLFDIGSRILRDVYLRDFDTATNRRLVKGSRGFYSPTGRILSLSTSMGGTLQALPFSLDTLEPTGEVFPVRENVVSPTVSNDGILVYADPLGIGSRPMWFDRVGQRVGPVGRRQDQIRYVALSPDGRLAAVDGRDGDQDYIWLHEMNRATKRRLTSGSRRDTAPVWAPSGAEVAYRSTSETQADVSLVSLEDGETRIIAGDPVPEYPQSWTPDGQTLLYMRVNSETGVDIWRADRQGDGVFETQEYLATPAAEAWVQISANGKYIAFCSDDSGNRQVYVSRFDAPALEHQISTDGGCHPRWSRSGQELFFADKNTLFAVQVSSSSDEFSFGRPSAMFQHPTLSDSGLISGWPYDVSLDARQFLLVETVKDEEHRPAIHVVENWYEEFRDREDR